MRGCACAFKMRVLVHGPRNLKPDYGDANKYETMAVLSLCLFFFLYILIS